MNTHLALIVMSGPYRFALPLAHVIETMRPLDIHPLAGLPPFVRGAAIIRGEAVPVLDLAPIFAGGEGPICRFVLLRVEERRVALAVESVIGIKDFARIRLTAVPELLKATQPDLLQALGSSDDGLVLVLGSVRIVPDEIWEKVARMNVRDN